MQTQVLANNIIETAKIIKEADNVCILTGAGVSAQSGIPTFRDKLTGLWENYRAEDLANIEAFQQDPQTVWSWYQWRRRLVQDKIPNSAHRVLADWQHWAQCHKAQSPQQTLTLITQNVDDLHEQAGSKTTHLHGHLWGNKCSQCETPYTEDIDYAASDELLTCIQCGGYIRPDIVWFGESLPQQQWLLAETASAQCDVFMSIGTSSLVYPAAGLSQTAKRHGAKIIEVNLNPTDSPHLDKVLAGKAGDIMPELVNQIMNY